MPRARSAHAARPRPEIPPFELGVVALVAMAILVPGLWAYTLIDPWETHYGEVARRILEEKDWVFLRWQDEVFQSKPSLTFWLMAASMKLFGVAEGGGYSGEMVGSPLVILALRLPFTLFGAFGLVMTWYALVRLVGRRVAWLALIVLGTSPFYVLVSRQAITDMPMVACLMGAIACFALAADDGGEAPLGRLMGRINGLHLFLVVFTLAVGGQALYYFAYFYSDPSLAHGLRVSAPHLALALPMLGAVAALWAWTLWLQPVTTRRQLLMLWFYFFIGVSVLAKGPPALAVAGGTCLLYLIVTGRWRLLFEVEIPRGILIAVAVAVPWHVAMFLKAGMPYYNEYVLHHLLSRASQGVHGDTGTFNYFISQLGIGMWPWSGLLPAAVAGVFTTRLRGSAGHMRLVVSLWAAFGVALFCLVHTKFHHYILPVVPALALLVAFFLDDLLSGRIPRAALASATAVAIVVLVGRDMMGEQKQLIELFVYRYNRPWPSGPPWNVDVSDTLARFTLLFALGFAGLALVRLRWHALGGLLAVAIVWALYAGDGYMGEAGPHWGQRELHRTYYDERDIHGVDIQYQSLRQLAEDWGPDAGDYKVRSALPAHIQPGESAVARLHVPGEDEPIELDGWISNLGEDNFSIHVPDDARDAISKLVERGRKAPPSDTSPWVQVDADRLIAWQLNWRGENFWSNGEIWGRLPKTQTVFINDNDGFRQYLEEHGREGRTYYVITEASRTGRIDSHLPTDRAKDTLEVRDNSCNKFTLLSFTL